MRRRNHRRRYAGHREKLLTLLRSNDEESFNQAVALNESVGLLTQQEIDDAQAILYFANGESWRVNPYPYWLNLLRAYAHRQTDSREARKIANYLNSKAENIRGFLSEMLQNQEVDFKRTKIRQMGYGNRVLQDVTAVSTNGEEDDVFANFFYTDGDYQCHAGIFYMSPNGDFSDWNSGMLPIGSFSDDWKTEIDKRYRWLISAISEMESFIENQGPGGYIGS